MRKKSIPTPIARPSDLGLAPRALMPVRPRAVLPTVAALLAMAAIGCDHDRESIQRDEATVSIGSTLHASPVSLVSDPRAPRPYDPSEPLPALGIIESPPPPPPAPAPAPTTHPYPVKGGMKAVHPIAPLKKTPKLGGDVSPVLPETT